ncbi:MULTISPECIES: cytochrome c1 [Pseudacidovorax]|uniref:Ubiquinol-cytochrome c reductase cytochrome c1 subunit n=1 Tax=Pseudacidovorax intermedius TaxID=433924 RepID=A0A370FIX9_9BURK|nr:MULTISPECIES: cytochrome c1 [Pseudacidovorax]MBO9652182.1 cytochrome c1 [Variovorax sp.]MBP6895261.1 cytochrome c1 [Pseudacidovorax sp.]RDI27127.1 ubiquinol-cytochrome c reductase cytochrome c1 subunit [Pseudacidovorax intermedius]
MKKLILSLMMALGLATGALAAEGGIAWDKAPVRTNDLASLQNGAKLFVNYCLNCHSAAFMRYNRLQDIGLSEQQIKDNLLFTTEKVGDTMKANIDARQAKEWFGGTPPDLTLVARSRAGHNGTGADYLYTYLRTYYRDDTKATGWNNLAFPSVGMPNVLWELQGERRPVYDKVEQHGHETEVLKGWEQVKPGKMTPLQFDQAVGDLVNYLQWMAEPAQNTRVRVGVWVLLFLAVSLVFVWRLNAAFWKDVK